MSEKVQQTKFRPEVEDFRRKFGGLLSISSPQLIVGLSAMVLGHRAEEFYPEDAAKWIYEGSTVLVYLGDVAGGGEPDDLSIRVLQLLDTVIGGDFDEELRQEYVVALRAELAFALINVVGAIMVFDEATGFSSFGKSRVSKNKKEG